MSPGSRGAIFHTGLAGKAVADFGLGGHRDRVTEGGASERLIPLQGSGVVLGAGAIGLGQKLLSYLRAGGLLGEQARSRRGEQHSE